MQEAFLRAWRAVGVLRPGPGVAAHLAVRHPAQRGDRLGAGPPAPARRSPTGSDRAPRGPPTTSSTARSPSWQVETALAELDDDHRRVLVEVHWRGPAVPRGGRRPRHPGGHGEEPRVLRPARHAQRARGAGVARWLSARSPARRGSRPWPAGWWRSCRPTRRRACSRTSTAAPTCRAEADSLLARRRAHRSAPTPAAPAPAEPPPADLGDRIAGPRGARAARSSGRPARGGDERRGGGRRRRGRVTRDPGERRLRGEPVAFAPRGGGRGRVRGGRARGRRLARRARTSAGSIPTSPTRCGSPRPAAATPTGSPAGTFRPDDDGEVDAELHCALPAEEMGRAWATTPEGGIALDTEPA